MLKRGKSSATNILETYTPFVKQAAKIGLQSLYADPKKAIEMYGDNFDLAKAMDELKGGNYLWVRARAIDADVVNDNGDYFSKEELLKEKEVKGKKIPAYKTFEGVPIYTNHKNDDIELAKGMVVYAEWDDEENCVYCTFFINEDAYPDLAHSIRTGVVHDMSMGVSVQYGICSKCQNKATTEKEYCSCLKKYKGKKDPDGKDKIFEYNYDLKFIEFSCVGDGAFETCEIQEIYDVDEILNKSKELNKKATHVRSIIREATKSPSINLVTNRNDRLQISELFTQSQNLIKLAQSAGTLIGGDIIPPHSINNASVAAVLQGLGIDASAGLSVLDLLNLALNFSEVAVLNLFSRKDNIDLAHVSKITKTMADLQNALQDMIDDGIDTSSSQQRPAPMNQGALQQPMPQQPQQPQQPQPQAVQGNGNPSTFTPPGGVGKMTTLNSNVQQFSTPAPIGMGIAAGLIWADDNTRVAVAGKHKPKLQQFIDTLGAFADICEHKVSRNFLIDTENVKISADQSSVKGDKRMEIDHFKKIANKQREKLAKKLTVDIIVEDQDNKIVLSTTNGVSAFRGGKLAAWEPTLSEEQLQEIENGNPYIVAASLLDEFKKIAVVHPKVDEVTENQLMPIRHNEPELFDNYCALLHSKRNLQTLPIHENMLDSRRKFETYNHVEDALENDAHYPRHTPLEARELALNANHLFARQETGHASAILNRAPEELSHTVLEELTNKFRNIKSSVSANKVMACTLQALAKAVFASKITPTEVVHTAINLLKREDAPALFTLAYLNKDKIATARARGQFFKSAQDESEDPEYAVMNELSATEEDLAPKDMITALDVISQNLEKSISKITEIALSLKDEFGTNEDHEDDTEFSNDKKDEMESALDNDDFEDEDDGNVDVNALKGGVSGMAMAAEESKALPGEVVDVVTSFEPKELRSKVSAARTKKATKLRLAYRERQNFFGLTKVANKNNIQKSLVGWLADYANYYKLSTTSIVNACIKLASHPLAVEKVITAAIETKRQADIKVREEKHTSTTIMCRTEDLQDVDVNSPHFDASFKEFAINLLTQNGYQVDPSTFALTNITVSESGDVTATVESNLTKTVGVDSSNTSTLNEPNFESLNVDNNLAPESPAMEEGPVIMSEASKFSRKQRRNELLKLAQGAPGGLGAAMPGAQTPPTGGMGMDAPAMGGSDVPGGGLGLSSLTTNEAADPTNAENSEPEPGNIKPWGSVCPQCGSTDLDIANGEGTCNSCQSQLHFEFNVKATPPDSGKKPNAPMPEPNMGEPQGLGSLGAPGGEPAGAANPAPAPGAGEPQMMGQAGFIPTMMRTSYLADSDVYVKTAVSGFNKNTELRLPVGMICQMCGSRKAEKVNHQTFCMECGSIGVTSIKQSKEFPDKIESTITYII